MTTRTIYLFAVDCIEEGQRATVWATDKPTQCPNPTNHTSRAIGPDVLVLDSISTNTTTVVDYTTGNFETETTTLTIPAGIPGDTTSYTKSWPVDTIIWNSDIFLTPAMQDDELTVIAAPNTVIGGLTMPLNIGSNILCVSPTVLEHLSNGIDVTLSDGTNTQKMGRCTGVGNTCITVQNNSTYNFAPGTYVIMDTYLMRNMQIPITGFLLPIAKKGIRGKLLPKNVPLVVYYTNNDGQAKKVHWKTEVYLQ